MPGAGARSPSRQASPLGSLSARASASMPGRRGRAHDGYAAFASSELIPRAQANDIASCRGRIYRRTLQPPILQRKQQIGARAIDNVTSIGAVARQVLIGGPICARIRPHWSAGTFVVAKAALNSRRSLVF